MKNYLIIIAVIFNVGLKAQDEKKWILKTNLNYNHSKADELDTYNGYGFYSQISNRFKISTIVGRKINEHFYLGAGIFFENGKNELSQEELSFSPSTGYTNNIYIVEIIQKEKTISPTIFLQYNNGITERLSFSIDLFSKYDFFSSDVETEDFELYGSLIANSDRKKEFINIYLRPSLQFDITKSLGLEFSFAEIGYKQKTKDSLNEDVDNKSNSFDIGFKPENWMIGFYLRF